MTQQIPQGLRTRQIRFVSWLEMPTVMPKSTPRYSLKPRFSSPLPSSGLPRHVRRLRDRIAKVSTGNRINLAVAEARLGCLYMGNSLFRLSGMSKILDFPHRTFSSHEGRPTHDANRPRILGILDLSNQRASQRVLISSIHQSVTFRDVIALDIRR